MLNEFSDIFNFTLTPGVFVVNTLVALFCSLTIAAFYKWSYRGPGYSVSFIHSLVVLSMITALVIMVIGNNLARAFGLVGAMSIIRFRTPIKDAMDIVYIFFSLAIGMAAGVGLHFVAFLGTAIVGVVVVSLAKVGFLAPRKEKYLLQFHVLSSGESTEATYVSLLRKYCRRFDLLSVKTAGAGDLLELSFYVDLKDARLSHKFVGELGAAEGVSAVSLYSNDEEL